jgi:hypothetical protein
MFLENKRNKPRLGAKHKQPGVEAELALGGSQNQSQSDRATEREYTGWIVDVRCACRTQNPTCWTVCRVVLGVQGC